jgi:DNA-binding MurR/RpiR family transcriptional regulator
MKYDVNNYGLKELSKKYGVSEPTVCRWSKKYGVPLKGWNQERRLKYEQV